MEYKSNRVTPPPLSVKKAEKERRFFAWFYKWKEKLEFRVTWRF